MHLTLVPSLKIAFRGRQQAWRDGEGIECEVGMMGESFGGIDSFVLKVCLVFKYMLISFRQQSKKGLLKTRLPGQNINQYQPTNPTNTTIHASSNALPSLPTFTASAYTFTRRLLSVMVLLAAQSIMSRVQIDNISIDNPKAAPADTIHLAVTFSALTPLPHPLTWRLTYVGSAFSETYDQLLEEFQIGPIAEASTMSFTVEVDPPLLSQVPREELLSTAALIMSVHYLGQQFARIGYYVLNSYRGETEDTSVLPLEEVLAHTERVIIHQKPRVTKFDIRWDDGKNEERQEGEESLAMEARQSSEPREVEAPEQKQASKGSEVALNAKASEEANRDIQARQQGRQGLQPSSTPERDETDV